MWRRRNADTEDATDGDRSSPLMALPLGGCSYNRFVSQEETDQDAVGAGREPVAAPQRSDPEPGRDGEGLRDAGTGRLQGHRRFAREAGRRHARPKQKIEAANEQSSALARLLVVVENYPDLKSNKSFNRLMDELAGTENRIAVERMRYNEAVQAYNTSRRQFPANVTAKVFGFKEYQVLRGAAGSEEGCRKWNSHRNRRPTRSRTRELEKSRTREGA